MYDNGTLVRNYIPCYRNIDNKVGLYDLVSNTFFTDETNRFLSKSLNLNLIQLPNEYQLVDYVEASGNQRVLTDLYLHGSDTIIFDCEITNSINTSTLWCARTDYEYNTNTAFYIHDLGLRFDYYTTQTQTQFMDINTKIQIVQSHTNSIDITINGDALVSHQTNNFFSGETVQFFASYHEGEEDYVNYSYLKFYSFKVEDINGNTIAYILPCYRKKDGSIGLYDLVAQKFYENLTTSPLTYGKAIEYESNAYNIYYGYEDINIPEYSKSLSNNQKLAKRLVDNSIGIIDYDNTSFTVLIDNSFNFKYGNSVGHYFDEGKVITTVSEKQDGDTLYKCKICGKEVHEIIDSYSYQVSFTYDSGIDHIKVYKGYDFSSYEKTDIAYTRNKNSNNYSKVDPIIYIEIVYKNGFTLDKISTSGTMYSKVENNIYCFTNIKLNKSITIFTKETA